MFETFDLSGDGEISYPEVRPNPLSDHQSSFGVSQLKAAIRSLVPDMRSAEIKSLFHKADVDRSDQINFQEFELVMRQLSAELPELLGDTQKLVFSISQAAGMCTHQHLW